MLEHNAYLILAALAADDQIAEVHSSLAKMALFYDDDCHAAERHSARAVTIRSPARKGIE